MLSSKAIVRLRNRSRNRLLCTVSYRFCKFEWGAEGTFRAFFVSIHLKNGLKVRMMALLWRSQFFLAFRRERFATINGRFSIMGYRPQMVQSIIFFVDVKRKWRKMTPLPRLKPRARRKSIEAVNGLFSSSMNAPVSFLYVLNVYAKTLKRRSISLEKRDVICVVS
jgi:hypothetical protein